MKKRECQTVTVCKSGRLLNSDSLWKWHSIEHSMKVTVKNLFINQRQYVKQWQSVKVIVKQKQNFKQYSVKVRECQTACQSDRILNSDSLWKWHNLVVVANQKSFTSTNCNILRKWENVKKWQSVKVTDC